MTKPLLRGHFHQAMFFIMLGACVPLLFRCETALQTLSVFVYTFCMLGMFGVSAIYHRKNWDPEKRVLWKKLDHSGIFLMIAGTFTPVALLGLHPESGEKLLLMIWIVAAL